MQIKKSFIIIYIYYFIKNMNNLSIILLDFELKIY